MRAESCFQMPGRSWPLEMRPVPIAPTLMRLLGYVAPKTVDGTIDGNPDTTEAPTTPAVDAVTNSRRDGFFISQLLAPSS